MIMYLIRFSLANNLHYAKSFFFTHNFLRFTNNVTSYNMRKNDVLRSKKLSRERETRVTQIGKIAQTRRYDGQLPAHIV